MRLAQQGISWLNGEMPVIESKGSKSAGTNRITLQYQVPHKGRLQIQAWPHAARLKVAVPYFDMCVTKDR